ncbi:MAG: manganese efflux pump MntP family protein [Bacteroides sp.]|nr:manganese efflux pump MntP family protein [Roseburia sp.]MCM1347518.1 manganese efflux pump MntP family protein [Bacteroides sp.]MCM1422004.1 manganese efflux pump MntP family protein [Bacteroides sp.]
MLTITENVLLGLALAMDCFTVCFATGMMLKKADYKCVTLMAFMFGLFQAVMPVVGWGSVVLLGKYIESFDHWIAFALLAGIGGKMLWDGLQPEKQYMFNPRNFWVVMTLAVATSIDALAVGVSFVCMGMSAVGLVVQPVVVIGLISLAMSYIGYTIGLYIGRKFKFPAEIVGGAILVLIGMKVLAEHLSR